MEIFLQAGQNYAFLLQLIVHYLKLNDRKKVNLIYLSPGALLAVKNKKLGIEIPSLVTPQGHVQTQIFEICKSLFEILPQWKNFFLGEGDESTQISGIKSQLKEGKQLRKHLQKHLQNRTFFVGNHLSFADFFIFTQLYDNLLEMTDEQKLQYNNLFRWYKHIQNLPQIHDFLTSTKRFLIEDPLPKYAFLAEKKKPKKQKKPEQQGKEVKKPEKKEETKTATNKPEPKVEQVLGGQKQTVQPNQQKSE